MGLPQAPPALEVPLPAAQVLAGSGQGGMHRSKYRHGNLVRRLSTQGQIGRLPMILPGR